MSDDAWPVGPLSQYAFSPAKDATIVITRVEGLLADGRRIDLPLRVETAGISRAEIEARTRAMAASTLYYIYVANAAASYIVNVAYGIATEVVCTFDRGAKSPLRLVGMFVHPGGAEMLKHGPTPETAAGQHGSG
jgi:hypothetical protein